MNDPCLTIPTPNRPLVSTMPFFDLGTPTGWALRPTGGQIVSGTVSFRPSRRDGGGMRGLRFRSWLDQMVQRRIW
jgi:hypothetical protein